MKVLFILSPSFIYIVDRAYGVWWLYDDFLWRDFYPGVFVFFASAFPFVFRFFKGAKSEFLDARFQAGYYFCLGISVGYILSPGLSLGLIFAASMILDESNDCA